MNSNNFYATFFKDDWYEFIIRHKKCFDPRISDMQIIKEMFGENVYRVDENDLKDTGIVFDIGCNIGVFAIFCIALGAKKVFGFEPEKENFKICQDNIKHNKMVKKIKVFPQAIFTETGTETLVGDQGAGFVSGCKTEYGDVSKLPGQQIKTINLEQAFLNSGKPYCDILKMDVEGSEYVIIENTKSGILNKAKYIVMEFHTTDKETFGRMISKLTLTHKVEILGNYQKGGNLYAKRF